MTSTQRRRCVIISLLVLAIAAIVGLVLYALQQNINLFFTPTQVITGQSPKGQLIRIGGLVVENSVQYDENNLQVSFLVEDIAESEHQVPVYYEGILPDLFREGQGIIVQGRLDAQNRMQATQVLAKHDENYMPPEISQSLSAEEKP